MYIETVYGILPVRTWDHYRALTLRAEAAELHRNVVTAEIKAGTFEPDCGLTDINVEGGF